MAAPTRSEDPRLGLVLDEKYRLIEVVGRGGVATVYRAEQLAGGPAVAVKVLTSLAHVSEDDARRRLERFRREALALLELEHPNTIRLLDFGVGPDGLPFMVVELLKGRSLGELMEERDGTLPAEEVALVARRVCLALAEAHRHGIVHRDVKPDNIMMVREPQGRVIKLVDFGAVRLDREDFTQMTVAGSAVGSAPYMSPEQTRGEELTPASDLYSLGITIYEALTGAPPFRGDFSELLAQHSMTPPPPLIVAGLDPGRLAAWQALLEPLLAKRPDDRPSDAAPVAAALDFLRRPSETAPRRRWWVWALVGAVAAGSIAAVVALAAGGG